MDEEQIGLFMLKLLINLIYEVFYWKISMTNKWINLERLCFITFDISVWFLICIVY